MRHQKALASIVIVGTAASLASAQDYGDTRGAGDNYFGNNSEIHVSVVGFAGGDWRTLNSEPTAGVPRSTFDDPMFVDVGDIEVQTTGQTDTVEAAWWYQQLGDGEYLRLILRTQDGHEFVPFGSKKNNSLIQAYTYEVGADGSGFDFRDWVTDLDWEELTISYSYDGGQTVFSDPTIHDPDGAGDWDGTDDLHLGLVFPGDGVNWIQASYKFTAVPAPASLAALLGAGALAARRRRA